MGDDRGEVSGELIRKERLVSQIQMKMSDELVGGVSGARLTEERNCLALVIERDQEALVTVCRENPNDSERLVAVVKESRLWKEKERLEAETLTEEELKDLDELNELLLDDKDLRDALKESILGVARDRMLATDVKEGNRIIGIAHLEEVVGLIEKIGDAPVAELLALVHDWEKFYKDRYYLAGHEIASAVLAGRVLAVALEGAGLPEKYGRAISKLAGKLMTHGEGEYPSLMAMKSENKINDEMGWLFGWVHLQPRSTSEIIISTAPEAESDLAKKARDYLKLVSAADKLVGLSPNSLIKYDEYTHREQFARENSYFEYLINETFASFRSNIRNTPEIRNIIDLKEVQDYIKIAGAVLMLAGDAEYVSRQINHFEGGHWTGVNYFDEWGEKGTQAFLKAIRLSYTFQDLAVIDPGLARTSSKREFKELINVIMEMLKSGTSEEVDRRIGMLAKQYLS